MSAPTTKTAFSSFKSPRPAPCLPTSSATRVESSVLRRMVSDSFVSRKGTRWQNGQLAYDHFAHHLARGPVRRGYVGVQREKLRSWSWTRRVWLVLEEGWLYICPREDSEATHALPLNQIRHIERVDSRRFCLMVVASSQTWYLLFKDIVCLHDWLYDIRIRCPLLQIGPPTDFRHEMHVTYDAAAGEITGLPEPWIQRLSSWGIDFNNPPPREASDVATPLSAPASTPAHPRSTGSFDANVRPPVSEKRLLAGRQRSASEAVAPHTRPASIRAPSVVQSVDQFRKSPYRFRDVEARDLTGAVQPVHLLPTARSENCDIWKAEWSGPFGTRKVAIQVVRLLGIIPEDEIIQLGSIIHREVKALHQLRHPNVVRTRGFCRDQGPLPALISTWLPRGNIMNYLEYYRPTVGKMPRMKFLTEVATGLNYLHNFSQTIVHGNLRGVHVLINDRGGACISGFGLNPIFQEMEVHSTTPLTASVGPSPRWAAIEVIRKGRRHLTPLSDVFSFARTVVEVMTGKDPFHYVTDDTEVIHTVLRGVLPRRPPSFGEDGLWQFLERCWHEEPAQRPSMALTLLRMEEVLSLYQGYPVEKANRDSPNSPSSA